MTMAQIRRFAKAITKLLAPENPMGCVLLGAGDFLQGLGPRLKLPGSGPRPSGAQEAKKDGKRITKQSFRRHRTTERLQVFVLN